MALSEKGIVISSFADDNQAFADVNSTVCKLSKNVRQIEENVSGKGKEQDTDICEESLELSKDG